MRLSVGLGTIACLGVFVAAAARAPDQQNTAPSAQAAAVEATARIVASAQAFVATLDEAGRAKVQFPFDSPQKSRWSNLPTGIFKREGLRMGDLTPAQRAAAMALLSTALSQDGYRKVVEIMGGDEVLRTTARRAAVRVAVPAVPRGAPGPRSGRGGRAGRRPPGGRRSVHSARTSTTSPSSGAPSVSAPWMLQFGGHHLAINLTLGGAPGHAGAEPHRALSPPRYSFEGRTVRPLGDENDRAFALMAALDAAQRSQAILDYSVADLVLGPGQDGRTIQPEGLRASALTASQQTMLMDLVREWAGIANDALAAPRMDGDPGPAAADLLRLERPHDQRAAPRTSASRDRPSSSSTRRNVASITSIPSIGTRRTTTGRALRASSGLTAALALTTDARRRHRRVGTPA